MVWCAPSVPVYTAGGGGLALPTFVPLIQILDAALSGD